MKIQVALDRVTIEEAIILAKLAEPSVDWIEVGTSLIKEYGIESIYKIKQAFPHKTIVADIKTIDNAEYEFTMCYQAGADIATVMGVSPLPTIDTCANVSEKWNKKMMVDLLNTSSSSQKQVGIYRNAIFCHHISKDEQEKEGKSLSQINLRQYFHSDAQIAVAGGINPASAASLLQMKADVAIIGSAITKSADVAKASAEFQDLFMSRGNV